MIWLLFLILSLLTITDIKWFIIPNLIVLPTILCGIYLTKNWMPGLIALSIGISLYGFTEECPNCKHIISKHTTALSFWRGGDIKMIVLVTAFLGWLAFIPIGLSIIAIYLYSKFKKIDKGIAYAPYLTIATLGTILFTMFVFKTP